MGWPAAAALAFCIAGCVQVQPSSEGERCAEDQPCAKGLRCSFGKKRCYRPVDCDVLAKRLRACTRELMEAFAPEAKRLPAATRSKLLPRIQEQLRTQVVEHCRYDAAAHKRKKGTKPTKKKSWGEDVEAKALRGCLAKPSCAGFATCSLGVAGLRGDRQKDPEHRAVFPLDIQRPAPLETGGAGPKSTPPEPPAPAAGASAKDGPARDGPAKDAPARDAPARDAPAKDAPAKDAPRPATGAPPAR